MPDEEDYPTGPVPLGHPAESGTEWECPVCETVFEKCTECYEHMEDSHPDINLAKRFGPGEII